MRSYCIEAIRNFLSIHNLIEVHSPILSPMLIPERHIEVYEVAEQKKIYYLTPSPEIYLKQILAKLSQDSAMYEHMKGIYEITHSFRKMEQESSIHQKEFLMLEYYYLATSTQQMQDITIDMLYQCVHYMEAEK